MLLKTGQEHLENTFSDLIRKHDPLLESFKTYSNEFDRLIFSQKSQNIPTHILPIMEYYSIGSLGSGSLVVHLIEIMLERSILNPLTEMEKQVVLTAVTYKP